MLQFVRTLIIQPVDFLCSLRCLWDMLTEQSLSYVCGSINRAERALPEISEHTHSRIFICPQRDIHIYIYKGSEAV